MKRDVSLFLANYHSNYILFNGIIVITINQIASFLRLSYFLSTVRRNVIHCMSVRILITGLTTLVDSQQTNAFYTPGFGSIYASYQTSKHENPKQLFEFDRSSTDS
jgi:hypothetical protein